MEWVCLCVRGSLARGEGNGEMGDNAESHCTESFWPTSRSHPICHHNLFIRHSAGAFSEMRLLIMHVDLKWNWESGAQKTEKYWKHIRFCVFPHSTRPFNKITDIVSVCGNVLFCDVKSAKVRVWNVSGVEDSCWLDNEASQHSEKSSFDSELESRKRPCCYLNHKPLSSARGGTGRLDSTLVV